MKYIIYYLIPIFLYSHPHMFIDVHLNIEKKESFEQIDVDWLFDEMNSEILIFDYDLNGDRKFSSDEVTLFKDEVFKVLTAQYHSYTYLKIDNIDINIAKQIAQFSLSIEKDSIFKLSYTINLNKLKNIQYFELSFYDENYMTAMKMENKNIKGIKNMKLLEDNEFYGYKLIGWK